MLKLMLGKAVEPRRRNQRKEHSLRRSKKPIRIQVSQERLNSTNLSLIIIVPKRKRKKKRQKNRK
jgi:hypothetical protein